MSTARNICIPIPILGEADGEPENNMKEKEADMDREVQFAKTLEEVRQKAKTQNNCILEAEVEEAFAPLALSSEQMEMVYQYLRQKKIGIGEPVDYEEYLQEEEKEIGRAHV